MNQRRRALTVKDVAELTPRSPTSIYAALQSGMLAGTQNRGQRSANWVITQKAVDDWIEQGCPFPPNQPSRKSA